MEYLTMKKKIEILEHAFAAAVGAYYSINLTKDLVPGSMYPVSYTHLDVYKRQGV